jgi:signal recognition particle receptor subunit beta
MAHIDLEARTLRATLVVAGPNNSGKSSLLRAIHNRIPESRREQVLQGATPLLIDWLPLDLGKVGAWHTTLDLYAIPGVSGYAATRKLLLAEADGLLFVADSQASRLAENTLALRGLQDQLLERESDFRELPTVFFYAKQDLPEELILPPEVLDDEINFRDSPSFGGDALRGRSVLEALHSLVTLVMRSPTAAAPERVNDA